MDEALSEGVWVAFGKMHLRFASAWTAKWAGLDMQAVHDDWERVLVGCTPAMIRFAIENLPAQFPPNAQEFRAICMRAPAPPKPPELAEPPADPKRVARMLAEANAKAADAVARQGGPKAWAYRLKAREERGDRLTQAQRTMWRSALEG